ncbi:MAG: formylglycine-generating enzyme family protein [Allomuricauda sp.]
MRIVILKLVITGMCVASFFAFKTEGKSKEQIKNSEHLLETEMVKVKSGTFLMGCPSDKENCHEGERPAHRVNVDNFYIGKYEVTQKLWRDVMGNDPQDLEYKNCDSCPVENVSWEEIQEFIDKLNRKTNKSFRLPTEAEWEYAARGGKKSRNYRFAGGNQLDEVAWFWKNSGDKPLNGSWDWDTIVGNKGRTHAVGLKKPNELGLHDMAGNVGEWCQDWYDEAYYKKSPKVNPSGPKEGKYRVNRGGGWLSDGRYCRIIGRHYSEPGDKSPFMGFRLAHSS